MVIIPFLDTELTDNLHFGSDGLGEGSVILPVILVEGVLDGDDGVLVAQILVDLDDLRAGVGQRAVVVGSLEVKIVFAFDFDIGEVFRSFIRQL